jgi:DNA modification methylase
MQKSLFEIPQLNEAPKPTLQQCSVSRSTFYQGDCLVEMDKIADKSVDMILCDLPYGTTACKWDSVIPFQPLWKQYERIIKDNGAIVLTATQPFTSFLITSNIKIFRYEWIWEKERGVNFLFANKQPMKVHENVCVFYKKQPIYNPQKTEGGKPVNSRGSRGKGNKEEYDALWTSVVRNESEKTIMKYPRTVVEFNSIGRGLNVHPTQKPIELMEYLIKTYTNEGEIVLDNCMGSGTTGVACKKTGRHFIGIEKDEKYFEIAVSRVSAYCG